MNNYKDVYQNLMNIMNSISDIQKLQISALRTPLDRNIDMNNYNIINGNNIITNSITSNNLTTGTLSTNTITTNYPNGLTINGNGYGTTSGTMPLLTVSGQQTGISAYANDMFKVNNDGSVVVGSYDRIISGSTTPALTVYGSIDIEDGFINAPNIISSIGNNDRSISIQGTYANKTISIANPLPTLNNTVGTISSLYSGSSTVGSLNVSSGTFSTLYSGSGTVGSLNVNSGTFSTLYSRSGTVDSLNVSNGTFSTINSGSGTVGSLNVSSGTFSTINSGSGTVGSLYITNIGSNVNSQFSLPNTPPVSGNVLTVGTGNTTLWGPPSSLTANDDLPVDWIGPNNTQVGSCTVKYRKLFNVVYINFQFVLAQSFTFSSTAFIMTNTNLFNPPLSSNIPNKYPINTQAYDISGDDLGEHPKVIIGSGFVYMSAGGFVSMLPVYLVLFPPIPGLGDPWVKQYIMMSPATISANSIIVISGSYITT